MGTKDTLPIARNLSAALFSGTKQRVLGILYSQPTRSFYASELIGLAGSGSGAVRRELATLTSSGLVTVRSVGNQKHYQANSESPIFDELCAIILKTVGLADPLRAALHPMSAQITAAFVYGSVAKKTDKREFEGLIRSGHGRIRLYKPYGIRKTRATPVQRIITREDQQTF